MIFYVMMGQLSSCIASKIMLGVRKFDTIKVNRVMAKNNIL